MIWDFCLAVKMLLFHGREVHRLHVLLLLMIHLLQSSTATTVPDDFFYHNFLRRNQSKEGRTLSSSRGCDQDIVSS